jgi:hypothetical protein
VREETGRKVMRENEPVLLVFSVCEGEIILEKGEILSEKRQGEKAPVWYNTEGLVTAMLYIHVLDVGSAINLHQ